MYDFLWAGQCNGFAFGEGGYWVEFMIVYFIFFVVAVGFYFAVFRYELGARRKFNKVVFGLYVLAVQAGMVYALALILLNYVVGISTQGFWTYSVWEFGILLFIVLSLVCYVMLGMSEKLQQAARRKYKFYSYAFMVFTAEIVVMYGFLFLSFD